MAHISGFAAEPYKQDVMAVDASTAFNVGSDNGGNGIPAVGRKLFTELSNGDTIMVKAVSKNDNRIWEVFLGTYTSASKTLARTTLLTSSTGSAINFASTGGAVTLEGLNGVASTAATYTITSFSADRTLAGNEGTAANISATLTTVINDLIQAGILKGTVA